MQAAGHRESYGKKHWNEDRLNVKIKTRTYKAKWWFIYLIYFSSHYELKRNWVTPGEVQFLHKPLACLLFIVYQLQYISKRCRFVSEDNDKQGFYFYFVFKSTEM